MELRKPKIYSKGLIDMREENINQTINDNIHYNPMGKRIIPPLKNFRLMVLGQIISILGSALLRFALSLFVLDITGRADVFATLFAISNIPLLLGPFGGAIADRFNRKNLMVIYDFCSGAIVLCLFLVLLSGNTSIVVIGIAMILLSAISAMYNPTVSASVPLLVEDKKIESSNGIVTAVQSLAMVSAPILGSLLYSAIDFNILVLVCSILFGLSAIMEIFIDIPFEKNKKKGHIIQTTISDLKSGFIYVIKEPFIFKSVIFAMAINLVMTPLLIIAAPAILRLMMGSTERMYGLGMGIINLATVGGALTVGIFAKKLQFKKVYRWVLFMGGMLLFVAVSVLPSVLKIGYFPAFTIFMLGTIPISAMLTILQIFLISKVQKITPNEMLGRVMSIIIAGAQCSAPVGQILYGNLLETFNSNFYIPVLFVFGLIVIIAIITKYSFKNIKDIV